MNAKEAANAISKLREQNKSEVKRLSRIVQGGVKLPDSFKNQKINSSNLLPQVIKASGTSVTFEGLFPDRGTFLSRDLEKIRSVLSDLSNSFFDLLPDNFKDLDRRNFSFDKTISIMKIDGYALAWVMPASILGKYLSSDLQNERFAIVESNLEKMIDSTSATISSIDKNDYDLEEYKLFLMEATKLAQNSYFAGCQALSANFIDTILVRIFAENLSSAIKSGEHEKLLKSSARWAPLVLTGISLGRAYQSFDKKTDPIPRNFNRHATAHAVSKTQFNKFNSVIALAHAGSLLKTISAVN